MTSKDVLVEVKNNVATIILNRPSRANSLTPDMVLQVLGAIETFEKEPSVRVIVFTGSGKFFCSGMDMTPSNQQQMGDRLKDGTRIFLCFTSSLIDAVLSGSASAQAIRLFNTIYSAHSPYNSVLLVLTKTATDCPKPVIAKVNGPAMGGGWGLVFTADIILVDRSAYFQFSEVKRGIVPAIISAFITPQLGVAQTKQLMITGRKITAEEVRYSEIFLFRGLSNLKFGLPKGYKLGFITALAKDAEELNKVTDEFVAALLENGPEAMRRTKELVKFVAEHRHDQNLEQVEKVFKVTIQSNEAMYGMSCFMQRQKPDWTAFYAEAKL